MEEIRLESVAALFRALEPTKRLPVSEWADKHRFLAAQASAEPGRWRTNRTPYLRDIMDDASSTNPTQEIVFVKGAQVGGTEAAYNVVGYIIDNDPSPMLLVMPTDANLKRNSKSRLEPMIEASPRLRAKIAPAKVKSGDNTIFQKSFEGGVLMMSGANSATGLRSMPVRVLILDEVDGYPLDLDGEGSPVELAEARTRTFARRKVLKISTPTLQGTSVIWKEWEETDQRYFFVPCPHCDHYQHLRFENLRWEDRRPQTAQYHCEECGAGIPETAKPAMLARGEWRATNPAKAQEFPLRHGYHLNSLYSPLGWFSWEECARKYEAALKDDSKMKAFVNTILGLPYAERGDAPKWEAIYNRRQPFPKNRPTADVAFITAGVDIQRDRIELELVGWARGKVSYSLDYRVLLGDTADNEVWDRLAQIVNEQFEREDGALLTITAMAVDTGFNTTKVYDFCRRFDPGRVFPIKGNANQSVIVNTPNRVDIKMNGQKTGSILLWTLGVNILKTELYAWLRLDMSADGVIPEGYCFFPEYAPEYFMGLTAEEQQLKIHKGYQRYEWVKTYRRNEPLDCRIYARAAAAIVGMDRFAPAMWQKVGQSAPARNEQKLQPKRQQKRESSIW